MLKVIGNELIHSDLSAVTHPGSTRTPLDGRLTDTQLAEVLAAVVGDVQRDAVVLELNLWDVRDPNLHNRPFVTSTRCRHRFGRAAEAYRASVTVTNARPLSMDGTALACNRLGAEPTR